MKQNCSPKVGITDPLASHGRLLSAAAIVTAAAFSLLVPAPAKSSPVVRLSARLDRPSASISPRQAIGGAIDGQEQGDIARTLTPAHVRAMLTADLGPLTYRLRTELGCEAWHWNPAGHWSDPQRRDGYWTSDSRPGGSIPISNGYFLPRRGNTIDQAENNGYSRLDDGDPRSYWKSNPYLDHHFTREDNRQHPQWILFDLGRHFPINQIQIRWGQPFATHYAVEYWSGDDAVGDNDSGNWEAFLGGVVTDGKGGLVALRLAPGLISARYVRLRMLESSHTARAGSRDVRDRLGYAVYEIQLGWKEASGAFHDVIRHAPDRQKQTLVYVSSTDPWHRPVDRDVNIEQPGFDRVFHCGLSRGLPVMIPIPILYGTPEDAAAEIRYLRAQRYPVRQVELGEEPDGNFIPPQDYGALYVQWARALRQVDPSLQIGGPSLQTTVVDYREWPDRTSPRSWLGQFLQYLGEHGRLADFQFFSFEWYPFDNPCSPEAANLRRAPQALDSALSRIQASGLPPSAHVVVTELGYSAFAARGEVDMTGALFETETMAQLLARGAEAVYLYGYAPNQLLEEVPCPRSSEGQNWGQNMLFLMDNSGQIRWPTAEYYGVRLLTRQWLDPDGGRETVYPLAASPSDGIVTGYAVERSRRSWAFLVFNKDPVRARRVRLQLLKGQRPVPLRGPFTLYQYSGRQYRWHAHQDQGYPSPDLPPERVPVRTRSLPPILLPPYSITVLKTD